MMKQKRQRALLAWLHTGRVTVRNMEGRRWDRNRLLTLVAALLLLTVLACWARVLTTPLGAAPATVQSAAPAAPTLDPAASLPMVRLMSPGAVQTDVVVLGVLAGGRVPLALLSVDGQQAEAYAPGQRLGPSTVVASISAGAVELRRAGQAQSLPVPALPPLATDGIVPATP